MGLPTKDITINNGKIREPFAIGGNVVQTNTFWSGPVSYLTGAGNRKITAADLGLTWILSIRACYSDDGTRLMIPVLVGGGVPVQEFDMLIASIAGVEVADASNQSTKKFRIVAEGLY